MIDIESPDYANTPVSDRRPRFDYAPLDPAAEPGVSIVTPFFNTAEEFHETAASVLGQSYQQWEWLIVNDGSTDPGSRAVLDRYRDSDPRISVLDLDANRGLSAARNHGFRAARAPYVVQLDSDDLLEPTAVEKWAWFLETHARCGFVKGYTIGFGAEEYVWDMGFHNGEEFLNANLVAPTSMLRRKVLEESGGYDESNRAGLEDWDFWLRCAHAGHWGATVPEYLDWYRRRHAHRERWSNWDHSTRQKAFGRELRRRYSALWRGSFPAVEAEWNLPNAEAPDGLSWHNRLRKTRPRLLMVLPYLDVGGADKFNLDLLEQVTRKGWEVTIATTLDHRHPWLHEFSRRTPDVFVLSRFLRLVDYPRFLRYLIESRQVDVVQVSGSELGYQLLPYLRHHCRDTTFVDLSHIEEEHWKNGGHPKMGVDYQETLDLNVVVSEHLKRWMVRRGADAERIEVCHINVDTALWRPDPLSRRRVRREMKLGDDVAMILYAARLVPQKQPEVFAETVRRLANGGTRFVAVVAGDGERAGWLRDFVDLHGLRASVRFVGAVPSERIRDLMTAADVFFLPSRWEGIALTAYEAMACALPFVGADVGGQRELVTPDCGYLIPTGDADVEAERYVEILRELIDNPHLRRKLGDAGRERVGRDFRLEAMTERILSIWSRAATLRTERPRPVPSAGLARIVANQTVEYARLSRVADDLWSQTHGANGHIGLRRLVYRRATTWLEPCYRWAIRRGWSWLPPLVGRFKRRWLRIAA